MNMLCAVKGAIRPGAMCGAVIVGNKLCGFDDACEHQQKNVDSLDISDERVEKTPKSIHNPGRLHRYAGSFGGGA